MTKWILAAGAAAIALSVPTMAQPGKGGGSKGEKGGAAKVERGSGGGQGAVERGNPGRQADRQVVRIERGDRGKGPERQFERDRQRADMSVRSAGRKVERAERKVERTDRRSAGVPAIAKRDIREARAIERDDVRRIDGARFADDDRRGGRFYADGCPPGLAKKGNGCLPPGQARKLIGAALPASLAAGALAGPYSQWYRDDDRYYYRNDGDYIYRVEREGGLIDALFPFQDRDYSYYPIGMTYPAEYNSYNVPYQYRSFYPDGNEYNYRYGDGAIYQVNRSNSAIQSIVALLAGDLGVGQTMPSDYGVYNVPLAYRDRYYDTPEAMYRYNDGYIYQADPKTQLITAVIDALV